MMSNGIFSSRKQRFSTFYKIIEKLSKKVLTIEENFDKIIFADAVQIPQSCTLDLDN